MPAEEVRFLLVHHTSEPGSNYQPGGVVKLLRSVYAFHTGPSKGWPDVAYNFFVDKFGTIYEGRTGSLAGPLRGSATGGNQGYSQLCCFIGDFSAAPPPPPALEAMYSLLAWLADRYRVDTSPGSSVTFTSLGSNKWPAGATVTVPTIAGHRDVSETDCPGEACYALVRSTFPREVTARRGAPVPAPPPPSTAPATTAPPPTTAPAPSTTAPVETTEPPVTDPPDTTPSTTLSRTTTTAELDARRAAAGRPDSGGSSKAAPLIAAVGVGGAALVGVAAVSARRRSLAAADGTVADGTVADGTVADGTVADGTVASVTAGTPEPIAGGVGPTQADEDRSAFVAWRSASGDPPAAVRRGADADLADLAGQPNWSDHVAARWRAATGDSTADDSGFVVASNGEQAVVLVSGTATATAVIGDGPAEPVAPEQVTKVWLRDATVTLVVGASTTTLSASGITGPIDRITHA